MNMRMIGFQPGSIIRKSLSKGGEDSIPKTILF
jgi:hypothetical protein